MRRLPKHRDVHHEPSALQLLRSPRPGVRAWRHVVGAGAHIRHGKVGHEVGHETFVHEKVMEAVLDGRPVVLGRQRLAIVVLAAENRGHAERGLGRGRRVVAVHDEAVQLVDEVLVTHELEKDVRLEGIENDVKDVELLRDEARRFGHFRDILLGGDARRTRD